MAQITAAMVKELREKTGAGMMDCKKALEATNGDFAAATDWLREKGISTAAKKASRIAAEGMTDILIEGNKAVIVEVNSETDFVAKNPEFKEMVTEILKALIKSDAKTVEEALELPSSVGTINDLIVAKTAKIGEKLSLRRFAILNKDDSQLFGHYIHMGSKIGVLLVVNGTNDEVCHNVAMHAAAMRPTYLKKEDVSPEELEFVREDEIPTDRVEKERAIFKEQAMNEGKPAEIAEKMVLGRLNKFYKEICLEEQEFVMDSSVDVKTYVKNNGGNIVAMVRYEVGEGMQKREENFAEEVAKQMNK